MSFLGTLIGCGNSPYPVADAGEKVFYSYLLRSYPLDPVNAQSIPGMGYLGAICEPLFEYHYLKRPLEMQPLLARAIPQFEEITVPGLAAGEPDRVLYRLRFEIWDQVLFHRDVCMDVPNHATPRTRELTAEDFEFTFKRIADPANNCPAIDTFLRVDGLSEWIKRLEAMRAKGSQTATLPVHELYRLAGPIRGVEVTGRYSFDLLLTERYPILLYWLAMTTTAPVPYEAVEYYHGEEGRPHLREWPIGTGPYRMAEHRKDDFIAFEKNPDWRGITQPQRRLPGTRYPTEGEEEDRQAGRLSPEYVDQPLPFIDRFEYRRDKEAVTRFGKFLQGYYDGEEIIEETFHQAVSGGDISPALCDRGIRLSMETMLRVWYFAFNMDDDIVGAPRVFADPARERDREQWLDRNRKLRQAMNLAFNTQEEIDIFMNGRASKAESPLPPGVFGHDPDYRNPYRQYDPELTRARQLLTEAGYPGGIDPRTNRPLQIELSLPDTDPRTMELARMTTRMFGQLGIDLKLDAVTYNAFVQKMRRGAFQVLRWGWYADYPDPQTFLLLLYGPESSAGTGRNNKANFRNARFDFLYEKMATLADDESVTWTETGPDGAERVVTMSRGEIIREMIAIFEYECPWIVNHHPMSFNLFHSWYHNVKPNTVIYTGAKYRDVDAQLRRELREEWNRPVRWPAWAFVAIVAALVTPAVRTYIRRTRH